MKALKIAFFACIFSVFFSFTAFADTITTQTIQPGDTVEVNLTASIPANNPSADNYLNGYFTARLNNYGSFKLLGAAVTSVGSNAPAITGTGAVTSQNELQANGTFSANFGRSYNGTVYLYVNVTVTVQNINTYAEKAIIALTTSGVSTGNGNVSGLTINNNINSAQNKLNAILDSLGSSSVVTPDFLGPDAIFYLSQQYFYNLYTGAGTASYNENGFAVFNNCGAVVFYIENPDRVVNGFLQKGNYYLVVSGKAPSNFISFDSYSSDYFTYSYTSSPDTHGIYMTIFDIQVKKPFAFNTLEIRWNGAFSGIVYGGLIPYSDDENAASSLNPDQEINRDELENQSELQSQQEQQLWQNVNTYKSQLDFGLNSWSDAADGLDYVTDVFLLVWNNSPTQIITLSLMLGIGMLAIGRGVMAARRQAKDDT